jgi:heme exporter protein D
MNYLPYIVAAYVVFAVVLAWDGLTPWLKQRRLLRSIRLRAARERGPFKTSRNRSSMDPAA